jgi:solute carrier family 29 (equilibrative nucleoside transporter), member 1/2/3
LLLLITLLSSAGASYLQSAVIGLSSLFGPLYLQGILAGTLYPYFPLYHFLTRAVVPDQGQGVIGVVVSVVQFLSALGHATEGSSEDSQDKDSLEDANNQLARSTFVFFVFATAFSVFALLSHILLIRLPLYQLVIKGYHGKRAKLDGRDGVAGSIFQVEPKIRLLGISVLYVFLVTLCVFPSITSTIFPVSPPQRGFIFRPALFVPFGFVVFNVGDVRKSCVLVS